MEKAKYWQGVSPTPVTSEDPFDELRDLFFARLRTDRVHLLALGTALACCEGDPAYPLEKIKLFAHRLRGGAAIFETPDIGDAANILEEAAALAAIVHADRSDASVRTALDSLLNKLAIANGRPHRVDTGPEGLLPRRFKG